MIKMKALVKKEQTIKEAAAIAPSFDKFWPAFIYIDERFME